MVTKRWPDLERIFHAARERTGEGRAAFLADACAGDDDLRREVEAMLEQSADNGAVGTNVTTERGNVPAASRRTDESMTSRLIGTTVSHYHIVALLGTGGMGVVYRAEDTRLHRPLALKFISESAAPDAQAEARLHREARAASSLDHPNIATVYEIGEWDGRPFIAMAFYAGETLRARLARGPMALAEVAAVGSQIASGLAAAHAAGLVHRDLKPANVMITPAGQVKILDFGVAKFLTASEAETESRLTGTGSVLGTMAYMAPEQVLGEPVDARADVWALGLVIFEMLTGKSPFSGVTPAARVLSAVSEKPPAIRKMKPDVPAAIAQAVDAALVKDKAQRTITARDLAAVLHDASETHGSAAMAAASRRVPRWTIVAAALAVIGAAAIGGWILKRNSDTRRVEGAIQDIRGMVTERRFFDAFDRAREVQSYAGLYPQLASLLKEATFTTSVVTNPSGAEFAIAAYGPEAVQWNVVGTTPLNDIALPFGVFRVRLRKAGFASEEDIVVGGPRLTSVSLSPDTAVPAGMTRYQASSTPIPMYLTPGTDPVPHTVPSFWIDRYEVTNRAFKAFVDAGGYERQEYWTEDFVRDGRVVPWAVGVASFRDATGRPGPATWQAGTYPDGQEEWPVTGVSWYEASAYAVYSRKSLPTLPHWYAVAGYVAVPQILPGANFGGKGAMKVGTTRALHRFGVYDLAGNVKEWIANSAGGGLKYIVGGGWDEPPYMFTEPDAHAPMERRANFGFRTARHDASDTSFARLGAPIVRPYRDYAAETPVSTPVFEAYRRFFAYDRAPLEATVSETQDLPDWRVETVTFAAAYGGERVLARMMLPKNASPPFQALIFMPGAFMYAVRSSRAEVDTPTLAFALRTGRAVIMPIVKGAFERGTDEFTSSTSKEGALWRDYLVAFYKDVARTIDYLESRTDILRDKIAYVGQSRGSALSPLVLALEPDRIKTAVLTLPGLYVSRPAPEVDIMNFLPRVKQPTLMLNGRYDYIFVEETLQLPFFRLLGTAADRKRRIAYDTGHNLPPAEAIKDTLNWLDQYLGPVRR